MAYKTKRVWLPELPIFFQWMSLCPTFKLTWTEDSLSSSVAQQWCGWLIIEIFPKLQNLIEKNESCFHRQSHGINDLRTQTVSCIILQFRTTIKQRLKLCYQIHSVGYSSLQVSNEHHQNEHIFWRFNKPLTLSCSIFSDASHIPSRSAWAEKNIQHTDNFFFSLSFSTSSSSSSTKLP